MVVHTLMETLLIEDWWISLAVFVALIRTLVVITVHVGNVTAMYIEM
jgi:hypothetical protein